MGSDMRWTVVVTDYNYADLSVETEELARWNAQVIPAQCKTPEEVLAVAEEVDALISQYAPITQKVIHGVRRCRAIGRYGIGVDNIDVPAATARGIAVINVPSYCEEEVSDHALAMLLAWARRIVHYAEETRNGIWDWKTGQPIRRLQGQFLGLLGLGKIARLMARKAKVLGLNVVAYDPYLPDAIFVEAGVERVGLDELLARSDFLSIHVPLTDNTRHLLNRETLAKMKPSACLINTSRGGVVEEKALVEALQKGRLAGACLDVMDLEPPQGKNPLLKMPQVILSPHVAWYSEESQLELRKNIARDIGRALHGFLPYGLVNRELAQRFQRY